MLIFKSGINITNTYNIIAVLDMMNYTEDMHRLCANTRPFVGGTWISTEFGVLGREANPCVLATEGRLYFVSNVFKGHLELPVDLFAQQEQEADNQITDLPVNLQIMLVYYTWMDKKALVHTYNGVL